MEEQRQIYLSPTNNINTILIANELLDKLLDSREVNLHDFAQALGQAYSSFREEFYKAYPHLENIVILANDFPGQVRFNVPEKMN